MKRLFYPVALILFLSAAFFSLNVSDAQQSKDGAIFAQAQIIPGISLELNGGINQRGKRTTIQNGIIDFGNVFFVDPSFLTNGDAYFQGKDLWLEATIEAKVVFNAAAGVELTVTSVSTGNQFSKVLYSTGLRQNDQTATVPPYPDSMGLGTLKSSGDSQKFRLIGVVQPTQTGLLSAKVRIEADKI